MIFMDVQHNEANSHQISFDDAIIQITNQPKHQYTQQEIEIARGELSFMDDRVFMVVFIDNKNNHIITAIVDALRKIHGLTGIPPIEHTRVQNVSLLDVLGRGMIGDLLGLGKQINIAVEVQKGSQKDFSVRGTITSSNAMRHQFNAGDDFTEAPDVIGINILDFKLPELKNRKMFFSRIIRAEYETKEPFLADKYSEYYIELPKMDNFTKEELLEEYQDLWDLCVILRAKVKEYKEVIKMQAVANPAALDLSREVEKAVAPNEFVNETINRKSELEQLRNYFKKREQKAAQKAAQKATQKATEGMLITALQGNAPSDIIEAMRKNAGITVDRLAELRKQTE